MADDLLYLLLGLALLCGGGDLVVRGASSMARRFGISPLVIGLTVVAFGTSAPELAVNLRAAAEGRGELAFGNVVGSSIANIGLIAGAAALMRPVTVHQAVILREIPMLVLCCAACAVLPLDGLLGEGANAYSRGDGLMLLLLFCVFLYYTVNDAVRQRAQAPPREADAPGDLSLAVSSALVVGGLAMLVLGGDTTVEAAVSFAERMGVSEVVIAITVVAVGTSLPELVTSVLAGLRGESDIAVGNVIGSNIFNLLLVLGSSATLSPVELPPGGLLDLAMLTLMAVGLLPLSLNPERRMGRRAGGLLLLGYAGYVVWRVMA